MVALPVAGALIAGVTLTATAGPAAATSTGRCDSPSAQIGTTLGGDPICEVIFESSDKFTVPSVGTSSVDVYLVGGGGGGGGGDVSEVGPYPFQVAGGGGAGGSQAIYTGIAVTASAEITVTIGAGGTAGDFGTWSEGTHTPATNGGNGATTSFDTNTAVGGGGGSKAQYIDGASVAGNGGSVGTNAGAAATTLALSGGTAAAHASGDTHRWYYAGGGGAGSGLAGNSGTINCVGTPCGTGSAVDGGDGGKGTILTKSGSLFDDTASIISGVNGYSYRNTAAFAFGPGAGGGVTTGSNVDWFQGHGTPYDLSAFTLVYGVPTSMGAPLNLWGSGAQVNAPDDWTVAPYGSPTNSFSFAPNGVTDGFGGGGGGGSGGADFNGSGKGAAGMPGLVIVRYVSTDAPVLPDSTTTSYTGASSVQVGTTFKPSASVIPDGSATCTGAVTYRIYGSPVSEEDNYLEITGDTDTSSWYPGYYSITAFFAGDAACDASQSSGDFLFVAPSGPTATVTPYPAAKTIKYGSSAPSFKFKATEGDPPVAFAGTWSPAPTCQVAPYNRISSPSLVLPVGTYPVVCSGGSADGYSVQYQDGTLTVVPADAVKVTPTSATWTTGTTPPQLGYTVSGFKNGDTFSSPDMTAPTCQVFTGPGGTGTPVTIDSNTAPGTYYNYCSGAVTSANYVSPVKYGYDGVIKVAAPVTLTVTGINPTYGSVKGGTKVHIYGTGFIAGISITIGGVPCTRPVIQRYGNEVDCYTGARAAGLVDVVVTVPNRSPATLPSAYRYK